MPTINNNNFYLAALKKHGHTPKGLNWRDKSSQDIRFEIIVEFLKPLIMTDDLVIDAGCGFGDFYHYLKKKNISCIYKGYDLVQKFVNIAKEKTKRDIEQKDILTDSIMMSDFYIASGSLNILTKFETYLFIKRCFEHSKKAFIFNLLEGEELNDNFNICSQDEFINFGKELGAEVSVKKGYLEGDFTLCFAKSPL